MPKSGEGVLLYSEEYIPISLPCKTFETIVDAYIGGKLSTSKILKTQHDCTKGRPTQTALHALTLNIGRTGAFNNICNEAIVNSLEIVR